MTFLLFTKEMYFFIALLKLSIVGESDFGACELILYLFISSCGKKLQLFTKDIPELQPEFPKHVDEKL